MFGKGGCGGGHEHRGPLGGGGPFGGIGALLRGLDLTDEQVLKIGEIKGAAFGKIAHGKIDLMELKKDLFKELLKPQVDKNKVREVAQKIKEHKAACLDSLLEHVISFSEILTAEQKKKLQLNKIRGFLNIDEPDDDE
jgi:Spy/CpxP family protein refolding chaperone